MKTPYMAAQVYHDTRGLSAFNVPKENVTRVTRNQFGARYTFLDGTALFIAHDLGAKWFHPDGTCLAARIGPGYR